MGGGGSCVLSILEFALPPVKKRLSLSSSLPPKLFQISEIHKEKILLLQPHCGPFIHSVGPCYVESFQWEFWVFKGCMIRSMQKEVLMGKVNDGLEGNTSVTMGEHLMPGGYISGEQKRR